MSILVNPNHSTRDYTVSSNKQINLLEDEIEIVECDTILGLSRYHLFNNTQKLCTWIRNAKVGEIHVFTLIHPTGAEVCINSVDSVFILNSETPLIRVIYTSNGFRRILD